jgi:hypothetical protein
MAELEIRAGHRTFSNHNGEVTIQVGHESYRLSIVINVRPKHPYFKLCFASMHAWDETAETYF